MHSSSLPELQCFISDSQLTRDAALHLGLGDMEEPAVALTAAGVHPWVVPQQGCVSACPAGCRQRGPPHPELWVCVPHAQSQHDGRTDPGLVAQPGPSSAGPDRDRDRWGGFCLRIRAPPPKSRCRAGQEGEGDRSPPLGPGLPLSGARTPQDGMGPWVSKSSSIPALCLFPAPGDEECVKVPTVPPHPCPSPHQRRACSWPAPVGRLHSWLLELRHRPNPFPEWQG